MRLNCIGRGTLAGLLLVLCLIMEAPAEDKPRAEPPPIPEGFLLIEEDVLYMLADEPNFHFHQARLDFLRRANEDAANDVRKAGAMLKLAVANAHSGEGKKQLQASLVELFALSEGLAMKKPVTTKLMDRVFARAHLALAQYNKDEALRHLEKGEFEKVGIHLRSASHDIEHAMAWAGEDVPDNSAMALQQAVKLAEQLAAGNEKLAAQAAESLRALAEEVARIRKVQEVFH